MDPSIFKAYDIRGLYPQELDSDAAARIGRGFGLFLEPFAQPDGGRPRVVVGRDMRESGVALRSALVSSLLQRGYDVVDIGRVATPMLYYAVTTLGALGGAMITASHNPGGYNGFKLCRESAIPIGIETGLREIRAVAEGTAGPDDGARERGVCEERSIAAGYFDVLLEMFPARPALKVVIDAGNGIAGEAVDGLLERLPLDVTRLYFEPDGSFPNHEANPIQIENLTDLCRAVKERDADLGVAFDGDGDRAVFVDEQGVPVPADLTAGLFAGAVLRGGLVGASDGARVVYDLRSSRAVIEEIEREGGRPIRSRVGHSFIKQIMREKGACFGGELSGHYYFRFPTGHIADDGAAAVMLMLQLLHASGRPLSSLWAPLRRYAQSGEINRRVADPAGVARRVRERFSDGRADDLDGLTIQYDDWWFNLRLSNTEPLLRLNVEADTAGLLAERRDRLIELMEG